MSQNKKQLRAFTLLELLMIIFIIGIVSSIMLVNFAANRVIKETQQAGIEVASAMREAQNYALTGSQPVVSREPCRFEISWASGGTAYSMRYWYKDGTGGCTLQQTYRTYTLKNGVVFDNSGSFYFTLPHAQVSFAGANIAATVRKASAHHVACTYADGLIRDGVGTTCP